MNPAKYFNYLLVLEKCLLCGKIIIEKENPYPICKNCERLLVPIQKNLCRNCGYPLVSETELCLRCRETDLNYISNRSLFKYSGNIKELIYQYKFNNNKKLSLFLAKYLSEIILNEYSDSIIVPVPGRRVVKKKKGWEHIDLIAGILKQKYKIPVYKLLIRKGRKAQKTLSKESRAENLRKSIIIKNKKQNLPESVVLLDDVFTTGTTINECARILKHAGITNILSLTIAID
jgi:competence protein ComFC